MKEFIFGIIALACFVLYVFFSFCDGFKIKTAKKALWAVVFLANYFIVLQKTGQIDLSLILPIPCLLALFLAWQEERGRKQ